jgi:hypothetical protein
MIVSGNILLAIAAIMFLYVCNLIFFKSVPGGDAGVGYAWALIIGVFIFSLCLGIVAAIIGAKGGFAWVGSNSGQRTTLVLIGLLVLLVGNGFFMMGEYPSDLPTWLRPMARAIPAVLPLLMMAGAAILLNSSYHSLPPLYYKIPLFASLVLAAIGVGIIQFSRMQNTAAALKSASQRNSQINQNHLKHIDTTDVMKDGVFLYVLTDANHDKEVREAALAKIKTRPDWQEELTRRLQNDWAPQAFNFLASNEVDNKALFPEPVRQGVLIQARLIRESIRQCRDAYDLYAGRFSWEIERVLRTVAKFEDMGVDFRPAMQELRNALDEKTSFEKPKLPARDMLDKWLKKH